MYAGTCEAAGYTECCDLSGDPTGCAGFPRDCFCDPLCVNFGDCCRDQPSLCQQTPFSGWHVYSIHSFVYTYNIPTIGMCTRYIHLFIPTTSLQLACVLDTIHLFIPTTEYSLFAQAVILYEYYNLGFSDNTSHLLYADNFYIGRLSLDGEMFDSLPLDLLDGASALDFDYM